jgi:hypothetical protein
MRFNGMRSVPGLILAACATLTFIAACGNSQSGRSGTFFGRPQVSIHGSG